MSEKKHIVSPTKNKESETVPDMARDATEENGDDKKNSTKNKGHGMNDTTHVKADPTPEPWEAMMKKDSETKTRMQETSEPAREKCGEKKESMKKKGH